MSVDVGESFRNGFDELLSPRGLVLFGLLLVWALTKLVVQQSFQRYLTLTLFEAFMPTAQSSQAVQQAASQYPFALDVAVPLILALAIVVALAGVLFRLVGIRMFGSESSEPIPFDDVTTDAGSLLAKGLLVGGTFAVVVLVLDQIPLVGQVLALFCELVFVYLLQVVALEDLGVVETVKESVSLFVEDPLPITAVLFALGVLGFVATVPVSFALGFVADDLLFASLVPRILNALVHALGVAVVTAAYLQVRADREESAAESVDPTAETW